MRAKQSVSKSDCFNISLYSHYVQWWAVTNCSVGCVSNYSPFALGSCLRREMSVLDWGRREYGNIDISYPHLLCEPLLTNDTKVAKGCNQRLIVWLNLQFWFAIHYIWSRSGRPLWAHHQVEDIEGASPVLRENECDRAALISQQKEKWVALTSCSLQC